MLPEKVCELRRRFQQVADWQDLLIRRVRHSQPETISLPPPDDIVQAKSEFVKSTVELRRLFDRNDDLNESERKRASQALGNLNGLLKHRQVLMNERLPLAEDSLRGDLSGKRRDRYLANYREIESCDEECRDLLATLETLAEDSPVDSSVRWKSVTFIAAGLKINKGTVSRMAELKDNGQTGIGRRIDMLSVMLYCEEKRIAFEFGEAAKSK